MDLKRLVECLVRGGVLTDSSRLNPGALRGEASDSNRTKLLLRAMIAAATADGRLDPASSARIVRRVAGMPLSDGEKRLIMNELREPASMEQLALAVRDPALRRDVYAASVMAADEGCPAGRVYLENLAEMLALTPMTVRSLREQARREGRLSALCSQARGQDQAA